MKLDLNDLRNHVASLSDEALLEVDREGLIGAAREIYEAEAVSRGLTWPDAAAGTTTIVLSEDGSETVATEASLPAAGLVSIAKFESVEEARFARTMLENEGIPVWFIGEVVSNLSKQDPLAGLELLTKEEFEEQARAALDTEIDDEELARQAEAAGPPPEDFEPEEDEEEEEEEEEEEAEKPTGA